jgi:hypothetical protein
MSIPFEEPALDKKAFNCPFCNAYANFWWSHVNVIAPGTHTTIGYKAAQCTHCQQWTLWTHEAKGRGPVGSIWVGGMIYPFKLTSPLPHTDIPEACKPEYEEARYVLPYSPRAAAGLLRLCIQKLCKELGASGNNINKDIGDLVKKGLDTRIQRALDVVRVTGNNAVHPGTMDLADDTELVNKLFKLVNLIVEEMITKPRDIDNLYSSLPEESRKAIEKRDS